MKGVKYGRGALPGKETAAESLGVTSEFKGVAWVSGEAGASLICVTSPWGSFCPEQRWDMSGKSWCRSWQPSSPALDLVGDSPPSPAPINVPVKGLWLHGTVHALISGDSFSAGPALLLTQTHIAPEPPTVSVTSFRERHNPSLLFWPYTICLPKKSSLECQDKEKKTSKCLKSELLFFPWASDRQLSPQCCHHPPLSPQAVIPALHSPLMPTPSPSPVPTGWTPSQPTISSFVNPIILEAGSRSPLPLHLPTPHRSPEPTADCVSFLSSPPQLPSFLLSLLSVLLQPPCLPFWRRAFA